MILWRCRSCYGSKKKAVSFPPFTEHDVSNFELKWICTPWCIHANKELSSGVVKATRPHSADWTAMVVCSDVVELTESSSFRKPGQIRGQIRLTGKSRGFPKKWGIVGISWRESGGERDVMKMGKEMVEGVGKIRCHGYWITYLFYQDWSL